MPQFDFKNQPAGRLAALKDKLRKHNLKHADALAKEAVENLRLAHMVSNGGQMKLTIVSGSDLVAKDADMFGNNLRSDSFVKVLMKGRKEIFRTEVKYANLNPEWNETFEWEIKPDEVKKGVVLALFDQDLMSKDDPMGRVTINLTEFVSGKSFKGTRVVEQCRGAEEANLGTLTIKATFRPNKPKMTEKEAAAAEAAEQARLSRLVALRAQCSAMERQAVALSQIELKASLSEKEWGKMSIGSKAAAADKARVKVRQSQPALFKELHTLEDKELNYQVALATKAAKAADLEASIAAAKERAAERESGESGTSVSRYAGLGSQM